jgi:hypothetical protein
MDFEFETTRTALANAFAAAGAELLSYQPLASTAVAAIPDTQPQKYAVAGTLKGILSMAGKMMGEDGNIADLTEFTEHSIREHADFRDDIERLSTADSRTRKALRKEIYDSINARVRNAVKAALASAAPAAVSQPNGDLPPLPERDGDWAGDDWFTADSMRNYARDYARAAIASHIASQPTGYLTDEQIRDAVQGIYLSDFQDNPEGYDIAIARAAIAAHLARQPKAEQPHVPEGFVVAPHFRGYAHLGIGAYVINHSAKGEPAELAISIATEEEKAGRTVGDTSDNAPDAMVQPEAMAVRLRFENVAGLDALEQQLRFVRSEHFPESIALTVVAQDTDQRFFMDHGVWHDRVTGQHMWTQDQYDEQWRDMYKAGHEDAAVGFNMLTGKPIPPDAPGDADARCAKLVSQVHYWMDRGDRATIALDAAEVEIADLRAALAQQGASRAANAGEDTSFKVPANFLLVGPGEIRGDFNSFSKKANRAAERLATIIDDDLDRAAISSSAAQEAK